MAYSPQKISLRYVSKPAWPILRLKPQPICKASPHGTSVCDKRIDNLRIATWAGLLVLVNCWFAQFRVYRRVYHVSTPISGLLLMGSWPQPENSSQWYFTWTSWLLPGHPPSIILLIIPCRAFRDSYQLFYPIPGLGSAVGIISPAFKGLTLWSSEEAPNLGWTLFGNW
jgi:hypothetical protein